ncbi:MAG TPA: glycoside hydrolase family 15 protein [Vicinamibacteria bacterium]|nr:glycoside hydrolase family 15 protein [Vicinamibacteria bacterium]
MAYLPIEDHGVIGDMRTAALVGLDGTLDWLCYPRFDSPSVFAALLDDGKGGSFGIAPVTPGAVRKQFYWPDTNVLVTRFLSPEGVGQVTDFMPVGGRPEAGSSVIRRVAVVRGAVRFRLECRPAFDYARAGHHLSLHGTSVAFRSGDLALELAGEVPLVPRGEAATAEFELREGEALAFTWRPLPPGAEGGGVFTDAEAAEHFNRTVQFWRRWLSRCTYTGRWREMVYRSALALKLLTYEPTGAIVAAPTCGLPEELGGVRNWDYRYVWLRDAALTVYALVRVGFTEEAARFMSFVEGRCREPEQGAPLAVMYGIDGRHMHGEEELTHLSGYRGSRPVRIGNGAYDQLQLDIYGELMDAVYLYNRDVTPISYDLWSHLRRIAGWVADNWHLPDEGIWEVRGGPRPFVHSKLMCWVALDRARRLAVDRSFPADRHRWEDQRDRLYDEIMEKGWSPDRQAFVQAYGSESLDASVLMMPLVNFLAPTDPRMLSTLQQIQKPPSQGGLVSNGLVHRYDVVRSPDGIKGDEGTFNVCTFWLVDALVTGGAGRGRARLQEARLVFEQMLGYANHLGLYAEETGPSGEALGNFPQAFTHLGLISSAFNLDRALSNHRKRI